MIRRLLLSSLVVVAACKSGPGNAVDLTIVVDASVPQATLAGLRTLTIAVTGVSSKTMPYTLPATGLPKQESVQLLPSVTSGTLMVTVTGSDAKGITRVQGARPVTLTGKEVPMSITLTASTPPTVMVTPATATVTVGKQTAPFMATRAVTWHVMGGDANGTIDASGVYTAPSTPGMYTIVATDAVDTTITATATVTAVDYGQTLLIGQLGGGGSLDGVGGSARFNYPYAIVGDGNGHLFIGDQNSCTLRKYDLATQAVTTLGGSGGVCASVDGMLGSTALFGHITSLAYDATDNVLYVSELFTATTTGLRKVALASGSVTTVVDASNTSGWGAYGMVYEATSTPGHPYLYLARRGAHNIVRWDLSTTPPTKMAWAGQPGVAGSGDTATGPATMAQFNRPSGLAFDGTNLYVADEGNNEIRQIVVATGVTTTIAGTVGPGSDVDGGRAAARFNAPSGLALRGNGALLVMEEGGAVVRSVVLANGSVATVAGIPYIAPASGPSPAPQLPVDAANNLQAQFGPLPAGAYDPNSNILYVTDGYNDVIRSINLGNGVTTVAGTAAALGATDGPGTSGRFYNIGTCLTVGHAVYFTDNGNATVRKYDLDANALSTVAGKAGMFGDVDGPGDVARFERPEGLFEDNGILYISDGGDSTIRAMDLAANMVTTIAGSHLTLGFTDGVGASARFGYPWYVTGDHSGHLYISDAEAPIIRQLDLGTRMVTTVAGSMTGGIVDGTGGAAGFYSPYGMTIEAGLVIIGDGPALRGMRRDNYAVTTLAGSATPAYAPLDGFGAGARMVGITAVAGDGQGHVYFGDVATLRRYDVTTTKVSTLIGMPFKESTTEGPLSTALVNVVSGIAFTPGGDIVWEDNQQSVAMLLRLPPAPQ